MSGHTHILTQKFYCNREKIVTFIMLGNQNGQHSYIGPIQRHVVMTIISKTNKKTRVIIFTLNNLGNIHTIIPNCGI